jgi:hypothetical protein
MAIKNEMEHIPSRPNEEIKTNTEPGDNQSVESVNSIRWMRYLYRSEYNDEGEKPAFYLSLIKLTCREVGKHEQVRNQPSADTHPDPKKCKTICIERRIVYLEE